MLLRWFTLAGVLSDLINVKIGFLIIERELVIAANKKE